MGNSYVTECKMNTAVLITIKTDYLHEIKQCDILCHKTTEPQFVLNKPSMMPLCDIGLRLLYSRLSILYFSVQWLCYIKCRSVLDMLATPLQERMDDWRKVAVQLDKEHSKGNTWDFF